MKERGTKTIMCSVLFLDIVEYSKKSVSGQIALKEALNALLAYAIRDIPVNDRIILDTGDGAAISFLGDVADAIKVALMLRSSLLDEGAKMDPPLLVRLGINLGPVRLVKDINERPNIVGDGINVAQRVMGFAHFGQILVSRSYYEAVSRMSHEYADMFRFEGSRTDKHVRDHEIYSVNLPGETTAVQPYDKGVPEMVVEPDRGGWIQAVRSTFRNASGQQRALYVGIFAGALLLLIAVSVKVMHRPAAPLPQAAEAPGAPAAGQTAPEVAATLPPRDGPIAERKPDAASAAGKKPKAAPPAQETSNQAPAEQEKTARKPSPTTRTLEETTAVEPGAMALVSIAVTPWGEVYLDGKMQGVSPPLTKLQVAPGKHEIEIRNTTFPAYIHNINVKANEEVKVKHKFSNY